MQCDRAKELIGPAIDGELAGADRHAMAEHLASCPACAAASDDMRRIGRQIAAVGREPAPKGLESRLRAALADEAALMSAAAVPVRVRERLPRSAGVRFASLARHAAALAAIALVSSALTWGVLGRHAAASRLEGDVVTAHIRSLLQDSQIQVASSDSHTVRPWFAGRVDFSPEVKDLTAEGFPLAGARLDYLADRRVGALVYRRRLHVVNVFMWQAASAEPVGVRQLVSKGFNVMTWTKNGIVYWAVSDLNAGELRQLQSLM